MTSLSEKITRFLSFAETDLSSPELCGIMSLHNLIYPQLHLVPCNESIYADVICVKQKFIMKQREDVKKAYSDQIFIRKVSNQRSKLTCNRKQILFNKEAIGLRAQLSMKKSNLS